MVIPNSVKEIGIYAFAGCRGLTSIMIPNSVTSIGNKAFYGCTDMKKSAYPNTLENPFEDGVVAVAYNPDGAIIEDGWIWGPEKIAIHFVPYDFKGEYSIPESVTSIGKYAFADCSGLTSAVIPESVTYIGDGAFWDSGLISLTFNAENCTSCGTEYVVFPNTIENLVIGDKVKTIPNYAFYNLEKLTSVVIPNAVTSIGEYAFYYCSGLTSVVIPNAVTSIGEYAFANCSGLKKSAYPNTLKNPFTYGIAIAYNPEEDIIEDGWIWGPEKSEILFTPMNFEGEYTVPNSVISIGEGAFYGCSGMTSVVISNSVTSILYNTFANCSDLTSVVIPISVTSIGDNAFNGCTSLTEVILPPHVETIGESAFAGDSNLANIIMGHSVKTVGEKAFDGCKANTVYITTQTPPTAYDNTFSNYTGKLYAQGLAIESYSYYKSTCWHRFEQFDGMRDAITIMIQNADKISGKAGDTFQLNAYVLPDDVTLPQIFWSSTNPEIATVDANGLVTLHVDVESLKTRAHGEGDIDGTCTIIAKTLYNNGPIAQVAVEDTGLSAVESIPVGDNGSIDYSQPYDVYNMNGFKVGETTEGLAKGIYIIRQGKDTVKTVVR